MARLGMEKEIRRLCNPESTYFLNWSPAYREGYILTEMFSTLFQVSSFLGINSLVIEALNELSDNEARKSVCDDALFFAASGGRRDTMVLLLEKGANVDVRHDWGSPTLHRAIYSKNAEAVELLLEHGANVDALDGGRQSALWLACAFRSFRIVELLLAYNADVNAVSREQGSPLFIAAYMGYEDIVRLLFENGARLRKDDWADCEGWIWGGKVVPTYGLDSIYELVKDEDQEEYIRILIEKLSVLKKIPLVEGVEDVIKLIQTYYGIGPIRI